MSAELTYWLERVRHAIQNTPRGRPLISEIDHLTKFAKRELSADDFKTFHRETNKMIDGLIDRLAMVSNPGAPHPRIPDVEAIRINKSSPHEFDADRYFIGRREPMDVGATYQARPATKVWVLTRALEELIDKERPRGQPSRLQSFFVVNDPELVAWAGGDPTYIYEVRAPGATRHEFGWLGDAAFKFNWLSKASPNQKKEFYRDIANYWNGTSFRSRPMERGATDSMRRLRAAEVDEYEFLAPEITIVRQLTNVKHKASDGHPYTPEPQVFVDENRARWEEETASRRAQRKRQPKRVKRSAAYARNPAVSPEVREAAVDKFREFHRFAPTKITEFAKGFAIPTEMQPVGRAKSTTYRSGKVDPETGKKPRSPIDYIHEHDAGVGCYLPVGDPDLDELEVTPAPTTVPEKFANAEALVKLGESLGCAFQIDGDEPWDIESVTPLPELYCTPDGKCLLIIQARREVLAMIWGGALGVFSRGIDG